MRNIRKEIDQTEMLSRAERLSKPRFNLGRVILVVFTLMWVGFWVWNVHINLNEFLDLEYNEKGDFFAGIFAPIAFIWLVFGYLQQGLELRQNTQTLQYQVIELSNSSKAQAAHAKIAQEQLDQILMQNTDQIHREIEKETPLIKLSTFQGGNDLNASIYVTGTVHRGTAKELVLTEKRIFPEVQPIYFVDMLDASTEQNSFQIELEQNKIKSEGKSLFYLNYKTLSGHIQVYFFELAYSEDRATRSYINDKGLLSYSDLQEYADFDQERLEAILSKENE